MDNWFGGGIFSVNYKGNRLHTSLGGGLNRYDGDHFGKVLWVKTTSATSTQTKTTTATMPQRTTVTSI